MNIQTSGVLKGDEDRILEIDEFPGRQTNLSEKPDMKALKRSTSMAAAGKQAWSKATPIASVHIQRKPNQVKPQTAKPYLLPRAPGVPRTIISDSARASLRHAEAGISVSGASLNMQVALNTGYGAWNGAGGFGLEVRSEDFEAA